MTVLLQRLNDSAPQVRLAAIQALGSEELGGPHIVAPLRAVLGAKRPAAERLLVVEALARVPSNESLEALRDALKDGSPPVRRRAFYALAQFLSTDLGYTAEDAESHPARVHAAFEGHLAKREGSS